MSTNSISFQRIVLFFLPLLLTCTNPVSPEYQFIKGIVYIEGFVGTNQGASYLKITESDVALYYKNNFVSGANAFFVNADTNEKISLLEDNFQYFPPTNFKGEIGQKWYLEVNLPNGKQYLSEVETINPSVPIERLNVRYDKQLEYIEDYNEYVPGHEVSITFEDPSNETNYYYWRFKTYDKPKFCEFCQEGIFRNNECIPFYNPYLHYQYAYYFTYWCDSDCWVIDYGNKFQIFSDELSNGLTTSNLPVANVIMTRKTKILVEIQQYSLTPKAYNYYKTIKDLVDNNSGFNTPLPATLIGNMYNPNDANEYVLGRFTASSGTTETIMVDRTNVVDSPAGQEIPAISESDMYDVPRPLRFFAPCLESKYRTSIQPEGWME